jgi:hypothetical protein
MGKVVTKYHAMIMMCRVDNKKLPTSAILASLKHVLAGISYPTINNPSDITAFVGLQNQRGYNVEQKF